MLSPKDEKSELMLYNDASMLAGGLLLALSDEGTMLEYARPKAKKMITG